MNIYSRYQENHPIPKVEPMIGPPKPTQPRLSLIVPFRYDPELSYLLARLDDMLSTMPRHPEVETLLVDSGSPYEYRAEIEAMCMRNDVFYLHHPTEGRTLNVGAARDYGVCRAHGRFITFMDVDLRVTTSFFDELFRLAEICEIGKRKQNFLVVPCFYLTPERSADFDIRTLDDDLLRDYVQWIMGDKSKIETLAYCSSVILVDRHHYLSIGGHQPAFRGHGYEDFELYHRLMIEDGRLPRADEYYNDAKRVDVATYNGFRAQLRLLGAAALHSGLFVVHLWHPRPKTAGFYSNMAVNREIWREIFAEFEAHRNHPEPLIDAAGATHNSLVLGRPKTNAIRCMAEALPYLGAKIYVSEHDVTNREGGFDAEKLTTLLQSAAISQIVFTNPYGNPVRQAIYDWCRAHNFPRVCFERGALPDSWFFDFGGFNADSPSYAPEKWDKPLTADQEQTVTCYINQQLEGSTALEAQGQRFGGAGLAERLRIGGRKVLFVPLQRPSDTVIRHFMPKFADYGAFTRYIDSLAGELRAFGWVVLVKKHPLEVETPPFIHAQVVPEETHFLDLIDLADSVALVNSGVGVSAMMAGKPCYIFGEAFYQFDGINCGFQGEDPAEMAQKMARGMVVDQVRSHRFIYYLREEFYSFGKSKTAKQRGADGAFITITKSISFYRLTLKDFVSLRYSDTEPVQISKTAPLFDPFRHDLLQKSSGAKPSPKSPLASLQATPNLVLSQRSGKARRLAKWQKFRRSPRAFFAESHLIFLRPARWFFPAQHPQN